MKLAPQNKNERVRKIKAEWTHYYTKVDCLSACKLVAREINPISNLHDYKVDTNKSLEQTFTEVIKIARKKV